MMTHYTAQKLANSSIAQEQERGHHTKVAERIALKNSAHHNFYKLEIMTFL